MNKIHDIVYETPTCKRYSPLKMTDRMKIGSNKTLKGTAKNHIISKLGITLWVKSWYNFSKKIIFGDDIQRFHIPISKEP